MKYEEYIQKAIGDGERVFKDHETSFRVGSNGVDVLDFRKPGTLWYSIRAVFDHERGGRVYITGDLGEAVVYPTCEASLRGMAECFTRRDKKGAIRVNWGYFLEKVRVSSDRYSWNQDDFEDDFRKCCAERGISSEAVRLFLDEHMEIFGCDIDIDNERGVSLSDDAKRDLKERSTCASG